MTVSGAEDHTVLVARLYECRKTLKFLHGDTYATTVQGWKDLLLSTMKPGSSLVSHTITAAQNANDVGVTLWLMAALVEILEAKES